MYEVGPQAVDMLSIAFMITYAPLTLPATWVLAERGLRTGVLVGSALTALGCAVRALSAQSGGGYATLMLGQTIASCGQPFLLNAPPVLAAQWFPPTERATADTAATVAATVGAAIGMLAPLLVPSLPALLRAEAVGATLVAVLVYLGLPRAPPTPPSLSAASTRLPLRQSLSHVLGSKGFPALLSAFALPFGAFSSLATLVDGIVSPYGFNPEDASNFGAIVVGAGLLGSAVVATLADKFQLHRHLLRACFVVALPAAVLLPFALRTCSFRMAALALGLVGGSMMPILPLAYELAAECTYPAPEALTAGLLMTGGSIAGIVTTLAASACLRTGQVVPALFANMACIFVGYAIIHSYTSDRDSSWCLTVLNAVLV
ncbi:major facilitator superfamily domain-containing protein [Pavlovales sp. CCMP2436]|nr:major facilitator superfamily domain-containing protein [Pavlovales sp. CCMP2436]